MGILELFADPETDSLAVTPGSTLAQFIVPGGTNRQARDQFGSALTNFGAAMLAANQPGASLGQAFGQGMQAFNGSIQAGKQQALQDQLMGMKMTEMQAAQAARQRQQQAVQQMMQDPQYAHLAPLMALDTGKAAEVMASAMKPKDPVSLAKGARLVDPRSGKVVAEGAADLPMGMVVGPDGQPMWDQRYLEGRMALARAGRPVTSIDMRGETEQAKAMGKHYADTYIGIQAAARGSLRSDADLARLDQLMGQVQTGKTAPALAEAQAWGKSLGIDLGNAGPAEAIGALSNKLALGMRGEMPGPLSNADRDFLVNMAPGLAKTPEGNALLIETQRRLNARSREMAKMAREMASRRPGGTIDAEVMQHLEDWSTRNPLFADMAEKASKLPAFSPAAPQAGGVQAGQLVYDPTTKTLQPRGR